MFLHTYLPQDHLRALARGESLPDRTSGAALFADICGFTPLAEAIVEARGARRGAEELTRQLDAVYTTLICEVERYGGSVIGFAGDAITCWFDDQTETSSATVRACACALAMQAALRTIAAITLPDRRIIAMTLKVAVATGPARRFVVGDPAIQYLDVLAGATVTRTATGEHLAQKGEVLIDEATVAVVEAGITIQEWRVDSTAHERFAVITCLADEVAATRSHPNPIVNAEVLKPWLLRAVYAREQTAQGTFLSEFRPCAVLFVRFSGIDYDAAEARPQLDTFMRQLQAIADRHEGVLLQLTIGDKGSFAYINFGAVTAHEDDACRAIRVATELRAAACALGYLEPLQIGITQGMLLVGAYGGPTRKTFGALADEVNLSARLMMIAAPGEVLVSGRVYQAAAMLFTFEPRPPLHVKGKAEPLPVFVVTGERRQRAIRLQEPTYALPMVGRQEELTIIHAQLTKARAGQAQVIGVTADAGLGKSRLVAEVIRSARQKGFVGYGGACQSDGLHTPYLAWKSIWSAFFGVDPDVPLRKRLRQIESEIEERAPSRVDALPLLGVVLDLNIPDNDFTRTLEPKIRQSALHALLEDCLKAAAHDEPLLIVIEDLHWIDAVSFNLLQELGRALTKCAICFVLAYRPWQSDEQQAQQLQDLPNFTHIELKELSTVEAEQAIRAKLAQLYPARSGAMPIGLVDKLMARAQGNPFYLEELLNYLRDRGLDPRDPADLNKIELPDSLHALILSRIDQLSEHEKITLRVACIIGRVFRAAWLMGYYPELGALPQVKTTLDHLERLDITPLETPEPELAYLFKHIVTHEVTYESLPFATRARLHEQLAHYIEAAFPDTPPLEALAFHYGRSTNVDKQREYLRKAGEAAEQTYANEAALAYYRQLLPQLPTAAEQIDIFLKCGEIHQLTGHYDEAEAEYCAALRLRVAQQQNSTSTLASVQFALGHLNRLRGDYNAALAWLEQAKQGYTVQGDRSGLGQVWIEMGRVFFSQGGYPHACEALYEGLAFMREAGNQAGITHAFNFLMAVNWTQGRLAAVRTLWNKNLALYRKVGDKVSTATMIYNLGIVARAEGDTAVAQTRFAESLALYREVGDKAGVAHVLGSLGFVALIQGNATVARALLEESLSLSREMNAKGSIAASLLCLGAVADALGDTVGARTLYEKSLTLSRKIGSKISIAAALLSLEHMALAQGDIPVARALHQERLALGRVGDKPSMIDVMLGLMF